MTHVSTGTKLGRLAAVVALACLVSTAAATGAASPPRVSCGGTLNKVDIYFWPHGHPAVPALGFPSYSPPHVEVYKAGSVAASASLAYLDVKNWGVSKSCKAATMSGVGFAAGARQTTSATSKITCKLPAQVQLVSLTSTGANNLWVVPGPGNKAILQLTLKAGGSTAIWISGYCSAKPVPGVK